MWSADRSTGDVLDEFHMAFPLCDRLPVDLAYCSIQVADVGDFFGLRVERVHLTRNIVLVRGNYVINRAVSSHADSVERFPRLAAAGKWELYAVARMVCGPELWLCRASAPTLRTRMTSANQRA